MLTFFNVLEGALKHLEDVEGVESHEVHEVEIELCTPILTQTCVVNFPEFNYMCFTWDDWRPGDFIGYRTNECYYCGKDEKEGCNCLEALQYAESLATTDELADMVGALSKSFQELDESTVEGEPNAEYCWSQEPGHTGGWYCEYAECKAAE